MGSTDGVESASVLVAVEVEEGSAGSFDFVGTVES